MFAQLLLYNVCLGGWLGYVKSIRPWGFLLVAAMSFPAFAGSFCPLSFLRLNLAAQLEEAQNAYSTKRTLGKGFTAQQFVGALPEHFEHDLEHVPTGWHVGTQVAVKVPSSSKPEGAAKDLFRQSSVFYENQMLRQIAEHDPLQHFVRGALDKKRNVLLTEYQPNNQTLAEWTKAWAVPIPKEQLEHISSQLEKALEELKAAGIVHSDLNPFNILIDSETLHITIIDLGIAAKEGEYPAALGFWKKGATLRGGRDKYVTSNQKENKPAQFSDDAHAVGVVLKELSQVGRPSGDKPYEKRHTPLEYGRAVSDEPWNDVGSSFRHTFSKFISAQHVTPTNMEEIARAAFKERLNFAKVHSRNFAFEDEKTDSGNARWEDRFSGKGNESRWSYGVDYRSARAKRALDVLKDLSPVGKSETVEVPLQEFPTELLRPEYLKNLQQNGKTIVAKKWVYDSGVKSKSGSPLEFELFHIDGEGYFIRHPHNRDVPQVMKQAEILWKEAQNEKAPLEERQRAISRLEWLWYWTNPLGRAGALTGDVLSVLLQEKVETDHGDFKMSDSYSNRDLKAFGHSKESYEKARMEEFRRKTQSSPAKAIDVGKQFTEQPGLGEKLSVVFIIKKSQKDADLLEFRKGEKGKVIADESRRKIYDGFVSQGTLGEMGKATPPKWKVSGDGPHGYASKGGVSVVTFLDSLKVLDNSGEEIRKITGPEFKNLHTVEFVPNSKDQVIVSSPGRDTILKVDIQTGKILWRWSAFKNGYDKNVLGWRFIEKGTPVEPNPKTRVFSYEAAAELVAKGTNVPPGEDWVVEMDPKDAAGGFGYPKWTRTAFPNWVGFGKNPNELLATFFTTGEAVKIDMATGEATTLRTGLGRPHGVVPFGDNYIVSDTYAGKVEVLDSEYKVGSVYDFSKLPLNPSGPELGHEWIQHTNPVSKNLLATVDSRRNKIYIWDPVKKIYSTYPIPPEWEVQAIVQAPEPK